MAALLLALLAGACTSIDAAPPKLQAIKTAGVISAVGDEFTLTKSGLTGFDNSARVFPIEAWGLDDLIVSRVGGLLSRRWQVQPVTYRRAAFAAVEPDTPVPVSSLLRDDPVKRLVRTEVLPQGLDAYVVVTKEKSRYGNRAKTVAGVGMINHKAVFDSNHEIHALYMIRIIDGHDFSVIDKRSARPLGNTEMVRLEGPSRVVEDSLQPTTNDASPNDKAKAAVIDLIEQSLPPTLQDLRLID
ncbi:MAG TPA: hypothetical protein VG291_09120 [Xanthobacteraceae bacterium]|nr:hypothetical protein [Xanthobacteraceae bacterium]